MNNIKAREAALEIIAILTGKRMGHPPNPDPNANKMHTLRSITAGENTIGAVCLGLELAVVIQKAIEESVTEMVMHLPHQNATLQNVMEVARVHGWNGQTYLSAWLDKYLPERVVGD